MKNNLLYIGAGGVGKCGKDLYCLIGADILKKNGLNSIKLAFADELKDDVDKFCKEKYKTSAWTSISEEKKLIRPILVAHGVIMRNIGDGSYWIKKVEEKIESLNKLNALDNIDVVFISDWRYTNEAYYIKSKNGIAVYISKFTKITANAGKTWHRLYQQPASEEEQINDPLIKKMADYQLEWEDMSNCGKVEVSMRELIDNAYLRELVYKSLMTTNLKDKLKEM